LNADDVNFFVAMISVVRICIVPITHCIKRLIDRTEQRVYLLCLGFIEQKAVHIRVVGMFHAVE
jgi:hypothetical protein